jgi:peptidoglycan/xylan/chitin deacetylase (PgdA/CDA1 family)
MYHYVRPIIGSKFPGIKGLELEGFKRQLDYLTENFNIVNTEQVINGVRKGAKLPKNACWLTFDDGYKDHSNFVLPELLTRNLHGAFFPPRVAIEDDVVLDVNSIHHILSCCSDINELVSKLNAHCLSAGISDKKISLFYKELAVPNRFDNANTIYVKRMLQHYLPEELRSSIAENLFQEFVGLSVEDFSKELYMNIDEVQNLVKSGMYVGSHGSRHYWLDKISFDEQEKDIQESLTFIEKIGAVSKDWVMCYPYGAYNNGTLALLHKYQASAAITTEARIANLTNDNPFELPRLDTNDFPQ